MSQEPRSLFFSRVFFEVKGVITEFRVASQRFHKNDLILRLEGVHSIAEAEAFKGKEVFLDEEDLAALGEDEYRLDQIRGCEVIDLQGEKVGIVRDIQPIADNDLLIVERGDREILVPLAGPICVSIDLPLRRIVIDPPDGLLDLNEI